MPPGAPNTVRCPACGREFGCGAAAGEQHCWCARLPHVMPAPAGEGGCYCPECLSARIAKARSADTA